jgi:hypothetical protein
MSRAGVQFAGPAQLINSGTIEGGAGGSGGTIRAVTSRRKGEVIDRKNQRVNFHHSPGATMGKSVSPG